MNKFTVMYKTKTVFRCFELNLLIKHYFSFFSYHIVNDFLYINITSVYIVHLFNVSSMLYYVVKI